MKPPFVLASGSPPDDVIKALEYLLKEARNGQLIGIAYGAMFRRRNYIVSTAGEGRRNPLFALGVVHVLADELVDQAHGRGGQ